MEASQFDRLTQRFAGRTSRRTALGTALASLALAHGSHASAQDATPDDGEDPVFLFVQTAASGRGEINPAAGTPAADGTPTPGGGAPFLLTLEGHSGQTIYFSDRPDRIVGAAPTQTFLDGLGFSAANPPNAALVAEFKAGDGVVVLELIEPVYDEATGTLAYGVKELATYAGDNLEPVTREQLIERLPAEFGPAALFIDDCPDVTSCYRRDMIYAAGMWQWVQVYLGPIPGGPYPTCFNLIAFGCVPCKDRWTYDQLEQACDGAYNCYYGTGDGSCMVYHEGPPHP